MMRGRKCSIIFMRKVSNRLIELEERYKELKPKARATEINKQLLADFCFGEREIQRWKRIVHLATAHADLKVAEDLPPPTHLREIARLPETKQEEVIAEVRSKNLTVQQTIQLVKEKIDEAFPQPEAKPLPSGLFNVIYADPPWQYDVNFLAASPDSHYQTMPTNEISALKLPVNEDSVLFLWATNPLLEDALRVMKAWGFTYKTNIVWVKDKFGLGFYVRGQHELLLIGIKGKMSPPEECRRVSSVLVAPSNGHSVKPQEAYELIERMYPNSQFLELFARQNRVGWQSWGNEI